MNDNNIDLELWGATEDDALVAPPPEMARIGERLFVRWPDMPRGRAARLPLRLRPDFLARSIATGDGLAQLGLVVAELCDDTARDLWDGLDNLDRHRVAKRYFHEVNELLRLAPGESSR